jgi:hypothetical protein
VTVRRSTDFINLKIKSAQSFRDDRGNMCMCVHRGKCLYVYKYLCFYTVFLKKIHCSPNTYIVWFCTGDVILFVHEKRCQS